MSILVIALAQATDCLQMRPRLSGETGRVYDEVRRLTPTISDDTPFYDDIEQVEAYLRSRK